MSCFFLSKDYHFSFCLVCLVLSMLISIVLTRLSVDGSILPCRHVKVHPTLDIKTRGSLDAEKSKTNSKKEMFH